MLYRGNAWFKKKEYKKAIEDFSNVIAPLIITEKKNLVEKVYDYCKYYAYYEENIDEIQLVRNLSHYNYPYKRYEFWELLQFSKECRQILSDEIEFHELLDFEKQLFKAFDEYCKSVGKVELKQRISNSNQALNAFMALKNSVYEYQENNLTFEKALAQKLKDMRRELVSAKWFLVFSKLLYLEGNLSIKEAVSLHLYAEDLSIQYRDKAIFTEINEEMQSWVSTITSVSSPMLIKLIYKVFKYIQDGFAFERTDENDFNEYIRFKERYYDHLLFWKNNLIKAFFKNYLAADVKEHEM